MVNWGVGLGYGLNAGRNVSKLGELRAAHQARLPAPRIFTDHEEAAASGTMYLGRQHYHSQGRDIVVNRFSPSSQFWVELLPKSEEYRVHVFGDKAVRSGKKVPRNGVDLSNPIWNLHTGYDIRYEEHHNVPREAKELAKMVAEKLGFDFGAVDIVKVPNRGCFFLEFNRMPGLQGNTLMKYATKIAELAKGDPQ